MSSGCICEEAMFFPADWQCKGKPVELCWQGSAEEIVEVEGVKVLEISDEALFVLKRMQDGLPETGTCKSRPPT